MGAAMAFPKNCCFAVTRITRLTWLTGNVWLAAALAIVGFGALHIPWLGLGLCHRWAVRRRRHDRLLRLEEGPGGDDGLPRLRRRPRHGHRADVWGMVAI